MDVSSGIPAFVRAAELGSFTRAARVLGVTPSGIGKSIARLESELGVRLLQRTTRRISLTDDGALFFEHGRRILEELETARNLMSNRRDVPLGRLRVSLPTTLAKRVVVPALGQFLARYPELRTELFLSDRRVNLVEDAFDVALRVGALRDSSLVARRIGAQQLVTIGAPAYLGERRVETIGDLSPLRAIVFRLPSTSTFKPWAFRSEGRLLEIHPAPYVALDDGEAIVGAVSAGLGVAQVPTYMAIDELARGAVVELLPAQRPPADPLSAVYPSQRNVPARTRAFIEFLAGLPWLDANAQLRPRRRR